MVVLAAAVALVGALCLLDLLLTFGVIRRLREQTDLLNGMRAPDAPVIGVATGGSPDAFSAVALDGGPISGAAGLRMVAFFSSSCSICPERVEPFARYLADHHMAADVVLAVLVGPEGESPPYLDRVSEVARMMTEERDGEVARAFHVTGFPAFCLLDGFGAVLATGYDPATLPEPVPTR